MVPITFIAAETAELRQSVFRFRYKIYVEHMGRRQLYADHENHTIIEPQDLRGKIYVALRGNEVVGTVRGNSADDDAMDYYRKVYRLPDFAFTDLRKVQITTKLMIDPALVKTGLTPRLMGAYALDGYRNGIEVDLIDCNRHLIPFFERIGYFSYCGWRFHKEFGTVRPMFLAPDAIAYLRSVRSFLAEPAQSAVKEGQYGGYDLIRRMAQQPSPSVALSGIQTALAVA